MSTKNFTVIIKDLENAPGKKLRVNFEEFITEIKSNEPVKAQLEITAVGNFIEVKGDVQGSVILECDRCLDEFEYELDFEIDEMLAKNTVADETTAEMEIKDGEFITDLRGKDIDLYDLLYQSVILDLPNKKVCGINCKGDKFMLDENWVQNQPDPRLDVFKNLNIDKK